MDNNNLTKSGNIKKATLFAAESKEKGTHSDKLFCHTVSTAVAGVIRHSMENGGRFRQQCYELLQVTSTKDAERELERRLMIITQGGVGIRQDVKQRQQTNTEEMWLDKISLNWDTVTGEQNSAFTDIWLSQVEDWS